MDVAIEGRIVSRNSARMQPAVRPTGIRQVEQYMRPQKKLPSMTTQGKATSPYL
jgi:hypothetical protein